ncbi:hypothetical protein TSUD_382620 [Trifolium subterraneum]|uniref:Uncharacterized protein n=1 Tax=Trifolium subterraneum TaxID=3900 RepID=A0A2Z6PJJ0_TRISU|nr:hypothetical protein TSUD_382620 [Trifolium subterraneum]
MVVFNCDNGKWYISSGMIVATRNDFTLPTEVYIYYQHKHNNLLMFDAKLRQFAPPYDAPCEEDEHPVTNHSDEHVDIHKVDIQGAEDIDIARFGQLEIKITNVIANTNHLLDCQHSTSSNYVVKVKQEDISITNVDTRELCCCTISPSNDVSQAQGPVDEGCYHFQLKNRLMVGDVLRFNKKNGI